MCKVSYRRVESCWRKPKMTMLLPHSKGLSKPRQIRPSVITFWELRSSLRDFRIWQKLPSIALWHYSRKCPRQRGPLANLVARSGNPDEALRLAGNARKTNPDLPSTYLASAKALLAKGDLRQTEAVLLDALKRDPVSLPAQSMLLSLYIRQGRGQEAMHRLADLVQQHPQNAGLHVLLGLAYFNLSNLQQAEANALDALKLDPKTPGAYTLLANINLARGAVEEAKANLRAAIAVHPRSLLNYMALVTQYEKEGNWEEAKKLCQKTHEIDPDAPLVAAELAFLYLEHGGDVNVAVSLAQAAKQKMPNSPITADALGWAFYKLGSPASAITQLKESTGKAPNNPIYQYHLGMAYMASQRADLAAQALRLALKPIQIFVTPLAPGQHWRSSRKAEPEVRAFHFACSGAAMLPFLICGLPAQTNSLALSSAAAEAGGTVTLELSLHSSGSRPVALQWTFQYPPSDINSIGVDDGR